jgi:hypothetical protein
MGHLQNLPALCGMRKVNEMVKRISLNTVNVLILGTLRSKMPFLPWGAEATKRKLIENLQETYLEVSYALFVPFILFCVRLSHSLYVYNLCYY